MGLFGGIEASEEQLWALLSHGSSLLFEGSGNGLGVYQ